MCGQITCTKKKKKKKIPDEHVTIPRSIYSAGEEKSPLFIFLHDQLPLFLGETGKKKKKKKNFPD